MVRKGKPEGIDELLEKGRAQGFVTYDERQAATARLAGLRTFAPGT